MLDLISQHFFEFEFVATFGGIFLFLLLEPMAERRHADANQTWRWANNMGISLLNFYILAYAAFLVGNESVFNWLTPDESLFQQLNISDSVAIPVTIFVLEFINYWYHRVLHGIPILWRIHAVHHSDTDFDATTSFRHHPFEGFIFMLFANPLIIWMGIPPAAAITYTGLRILISVFSHANIRIPESLDNVLRLFLITPDFHRLHHASEQKYTDSNYGTVVPWFDYLFGTATRKPYAVVADTEIGLDYLRKPRDSRVDRLLALPFTWKSATHR